MFSVEKSMRDLSRVCRVSNWIQSLEFSTKGLAGDINLEIINLDDT